MPIRYGNGREHDQVLRTEICSEGRSQVYIKERKHFYLGTLHSDPLPRLTPYQSPKPNLTFPIAIHQSTLNANPTTMPFFNSSIDSTRLFYRDYVPDGKGFKMQAGRAPKLTLVFLHGWPMSSKMFEHLIVPLCETYQFRCIAPDRRGFGSSDWTDASKGKTTDWSTFAGDVAQLLETLAVGDFVFVAASMGCTESVLAYHSSQYISQHCKVSLLGAHVITGSITWPEINQHL